MTHQDLLQLGHIFKKRRAERSLSLKEAENATSIRMGYLEAIEEGHLGKLISPIYAQGFIKKYAAYLELDGDQLIKDHPYVLKILSERQIEDHGIAFGIEGSLEVRGSPGSEVKWLPNLLWIALSALIILSGWFLARHFGFF